MERQQQRSEEAWRGEEEREWTPGHGRRWCGRGPKVGIEFGDILAPEVGCRGSAPERRLAGGCSGLVRADQDQDQGAEYIGLPIGYSTAGLEKETRCPPFPFLFPILRRPAYTLLPSTYPGSQDPVPCPTRQEGATCKGSWAGFVQKRPRHAPRPPSGLDFWRRGGPTPPSLSRFTLFGAVIRWWAVAISHAWTTSFLLDHEPNASALP